MNNIVVNVPRFRDDLLPKNRLLFKIFDTVAM